MFTLESWRIAKEWLIAEIETGRCIVHEPHSLNIIRSLTDDDLKAFADNQYGFSNVKTLYAPKGKGNGKRQADYIPWSDRLKVYAALVEDYDAIYYGIEGDGHKDKINYDRPLTPRADEVFIRQDYRDGYQEFRKRIIADEQAGKHVIHTDISDFAGSVNTDKLKETMIDISMGTESVDLICDALTKWQEQGVRGVPQGYAFTDVLLKIALRPIDRVMKSAFPNVSYYRYVDDIQLSSDDLQELKCAEMSMRTTMGRFGFSIKDEKTKLVEAGQGSYRHSFDAEAYLKQFRSDVMQARWWDYPNGMDDTTLLRHAYQSFVYPGDYRTHDGVPKYLMSHILRSMRKNGMTDFVNDLPHLIERYPERTFKLLRDAAKMDMEGRLPLNGLATYFFNARNSKDTGLDVQRLEYLKILKDNDYPVSEYDKRVIAGYLPEFTERNPFACGYRQDFIMPPSGIKSVQKGQSLHLT